MEGPDILPCRLCNGTGQRPHRRNIVWGEGPVPASIMLIGESPGYQEDLSGKPFRPTAPAGRVLHRALDETGLEGLVFITNIVKCRPPNNRLKDYPDAIETCRLWLLKEVAMVRPKVIVTLGATAGLTAFPGMRAGEQAETVRATAGLVVVGAYHPSYIARGGDPSAWPSLLRSLAIAKDLVKEVH
jgi:uracil-DNA glycosylase family 4